MADMEKGKQDEQPSGSAASVINVADLGVYTGSTVTEQVDAMLLSHPVVLISKSWCPFSRDAKDLLANQIGVTVYSLEVNTHPEGAAIFKYLSDKHDHHTVPIIFINGALVGGCDDTKALYQSGELERVHLKGLIQRKQTTQTDRLETAKLLPKERSEAMNPPFWFPNQVNNWVVRITGLQVFFLSVLSTAFYYKIWGRYLAVGLLVDFALRMLAGSALSPLGMNATFIASFYKPDFRPGPPKQFASFCGLFFSLLGTVFYFLDFEYHDIIGAIWMGMLAGASGMEAFLDFCLGCLFFGFGIQFGLIPDSVYRIYTASRQEIVESWEYKYGESNAPVPIRVDTDPDDPVALKYLKKTDEWTKDDFDIVRHIQVHYFAMPLGLAGLAVAFKIASDWSTLFEYPRSRVEGGMERSIVLPDPWWQFFATAGAFFFCVFSMLYIARLVLYPQKIAKEWDCPIKSAGFPLITITITLYAFLCYDQMTDTRVEGQAESGPHLFARVLWWIGSVGQAILTICKFGEWIGRRFELEHVDHGWMIFPVGLAVSALVAPVVGVFKFDNGNSIGDALIAKFFFSFASFMWLVLFTVTFYKTATTHNSDDRRRHGVWIWLAAPCILALAEWVICMTEGIAGAQKCSNVWVDKYFIGIFIFLGLVYASFPHLAFFGNDDISMLYWTEVFAVDTLAACAALFYTLNGWQFSQTIQIIMLTIAAILNLSAFWWTMVGIVRQRGIFTPEVKWGPLSFMKLTHEAFRGNMNTLRHYIDAANVEDDTPEGRETLGLFAAHFNRFCIVHEEHAKHEDEIIFKTFNDYFPDHAKPWNDDHAGDHKQLVTWRDLANTLLDTSLNVSERKTALEDLRSEIPAFFEHFEEHLRGEEDNLNPIGRKYLPMNLMVQMNRQVWEITDAKRWEIMVPFIILGLPRHPQRVRYLKVLTWAMPERAQQIGAIIYRNVDAVMWERLRTAMPEIVPRKAPGYKRYY